MTARGKRAQGATEIVRFLEDHGYTHVFGLPGSSMVSVLYELQRSAIEYIPAIHESVAVAAADGFTRIKGSGVAMLYMLPGTANGLGNLYNAWRDETPLIVLASQQDSTMRSREGTVCEGDLIPLVRPFTRLAHELTRDTPVRSWLEAAQRAANGPPSGPAFLSIAEDVYEREAPVVQARASTRPSAGAPDVSTIVAALCRAKRPLIVVGGQLRRYGGSTIMETISDRFEIPIGYEGGFQDRLGVGPGRQRTIGNILTRASRFERESDVALVVGARMITEGHPRAEPWFASASVVGHVNADAAKLEETRTADWSAACDPGAFAQALLDGLSKDPPSSQLLAARAARIEELKLQASAPAAANLDDPTVRAMASYRKAASHLCDALDHGWLVDESVMAASMVIDSLRSQDGSRYMGCSGASLGWATGAAAGVALASGEPVTCVLGDGSLRFGALGLWTIAARNLPITLVVFDNGGYASTRFFEREYIARLGASEGRKPPSYFNMDMRNLGPSVGQIIGGFGIPCRTLMPQDDVGPALAQAWHDRQRGPNAVVIPLEFEG
jgi:thiamine pyrophosphate-dependent acetolactate synthase large subunit-like protein